MERKEKLLKFFKEFHELSLKENFWYTAQAGTLLGAVREGKMIEWDDDIDLGISIETYEFLKKNYPNNLLEIDNKGYPFLMAKWVPDVNNYLNDTIFIDLFLMIPSTNKRLKKWTTFWNTFRFSEQMLNKGSKYKCFSGNLKILKVVLWPFQWITKRIKYDEIKSILYEKENPEFVQFVNAPNSKVEKEKKLLNIWERELHNFHNFKIFIPKYYDECLRSHYGDSYMIPSKAEHNFEHIDTINIRKRK